MGKAAKSNNDTERKGQTFNTPTEMTRKVCTCISNSCRDFAVPWVLLLSCETLAMASGRLGSNRQLVDFLRPDTNFRQMGVGDVLFCF